MYCRDMSPMPRLDPEPVPVSPPICIRFLGQRRDATRDTPTYKYQNAAHSQISPYSCGHPELQDLGRYCKSFAFHEGPFSHKRGFVGLVIYPSFVQGRSCGTLPLASLGRQGLQLAGPTRPQIVPHQSSQGSPCPLPCPSSMLLFRLVSMPALISVRRSVRVRAND